MDHDRYIAIETRIGIGLNAVVSGAFVFLMFGGQATIKLWGMGGLAFDLVPTTFMITLMMTVALTLITRSRLKKGAVGPLMSARRLPGNVLLRGLTLALLATLVFVPVSVGALTLIWPMTGDWSFLVVLAFKIVYSAVLGIVLTPVILRAAFNDGVTS
jgi:hypothetical protein